MQNVPTQRRAQLTGAAVPVFAPLTHPTAAAGRSRRHSYSLHVLPTPDACRFAALRRVGAAAVPGHKCQGTPTAFKRRNRRKKGRRLSHLRRIVQL